jgi:hypothetical protein
MPETPDSAEEIKKIRFRLDSIESTQEVILRHNSREYLDEILKLFANDSELRQVYLAIDGRRTQAEIVTYLVDSGVKISQPTASRRMTVLAEEGLIEEIAVGPSGGVIWRRKDVIERVLRLSKALERNHGR